MKIEIKDPFVGRKLLGFFRVQKRIGSGAFASVYLAEQEGTERLAVVKIAHPHLANDSSKEMVFSRFAAEFKASTRVNHPNIATVFAAGHTEEGLPVIAMEYVPGVALSALLPRHAPVALEATVPFMKQIGSALQALHRAGIIHRDITPNNIVVYHDKYTQQPIYKLLDFGIAKVDDLGAQTNGPLGTPRYMAPEQANGQVHEKTDLYGLGALMWWLVTGQEYLGHIKKISELFLYHLKQTPVPDPSPLRPGLPFALMQLLRSMLNPLPELRPDLSALIEHWTRSVSQQPSSAESWPWGHSQGGLALSPSMSSSHLTLPPPGLRKKVSVCFFTWGVNAVSSSVVACGLKDLGFELDAVADPDLLTERLSLREGWDVLLASGDIMNHTVLLSRLRARMTGACKLYLLTESPRELQQKIDGLHHIEVVPPSKISQLCVYLAARHGMDSGQFRVTSKSDGSFTDTNSGMNFSSQIEIIENFIGMMPDWLADISESLHVNPTTTIALCRQVNMAASSVGAEHLARLSSILEEMLKVQMFEDAQSIADEILNEYSDLFRKLLTVRSSCARKLQENQQVR